MSVIVNPGEGWSNTYEIAVATAKEWLANIRAEGIHDVELFYPGLAPEPNEDGRWRFEYRHQVTGISVFLETHGIDNLEAYRASRVWPNEGRMAPWPALERWMARCCLAVPRDRRRGPPPEAQAWRGAGVW